MSRPVRVLCVIGSLGGGGSERQLVELLKHHDPRRVTPMLYLAYRRGELLTEVPADIPLEAFWDGTSRRSWVQRLLAKGRWPCGARAVHLREVIKRRNPDVVMSWALMSSYEVALASLGKPIPHVAYLLNELQSEMDAVFPPGFPFRRRLAQWTVSSAAKVLANSIAMRTNAMKFYRLPADRITTLYNYRDFERIDRLSAENSPVWPGTGKRIVAIGRMAHQKGFDVLLTALAKLRDRQPPFQLILLGQGPEESVLRKMTDELGLKDRVHFLGFQQNPYVYLRSADLFVLSSRHEGLPGALIEALACRVPVVSTDCQTGPREILEDGQFGPLVAIEDADALAATIGRVLDLPPSPDLRERARRSVIDRYETRTCVRQLEGLLEQVAQSPAS